MILLGDDFLRHFEKALDSSSVYEGKIINVFRDEVLLENGACAAREVVRHKGAVAVLAVDKNGEAFFVRQFRYPIGQEILEVPAGKLEGGEIPLECARRELLEECGGIVQGMSGSPIVQNGKLVGAVTHVFLNKTNEGYGVAIQNMVEHSVD